MRVGLIALRFRDERLITDHVWRMSRQHQQIIKRSLRDVNRLLVDNQAAFVQIQNERAAFEKTIRADVNARQRTCISVAQPFELGLQGFDLPRDFQFSFFFLLTLDNFLRAFDDGLRFERLEQIIGGAVA